MKKLLTNNIGLKLLSVVAAIMLWLIVVNIDDPVTYQDFSPIRVTMLNEDAVTDKDKVYKIEDESDIISVRVWAKRSVLNKLSVEDFTATADMEKNIKFDNLVGIEVSCSNRNVKSADIIKSRENVVISIEDASTEQFNVVVKQIGGNPGTGYVIGSAVPEQSLIQISGPASLIAKIKRVVAEYDVTGYTSDSTLNCKLKVLDNNEEEMETTYLEYNGKTDGMNVTVTLLKTKMVRLKVGYTGTPAEGYSFAGISYKPETVEIAGTAEAIAGINEIVIPDEEVNIDGIISTMQQDLDITEHLPSGIRLVDADDASLAVVVEIEKQQGKTVTIPVAEIGLRNMPRGLEVDFGDLEEIEVIVMGTSAELAELDESEIAVNLDLGSYSRAGSYTREVDVTLPGSFTLLADVEIDFKLVRASASGDNSSGNNSNGGSTSGNGSSGGGSGGGSSGGTSGGNGSSGDSGTGGDDTGNTGGTSGDNTGNNSTSATE